MVQFLTSGHSLRYFKWLNNQVGFFQLIGNLWHYYFIKNDFKLKAKPCRTVKWVSVITGME